MSFLPSLKFATMGSRVAALVHPTGIGIWSRRGGQPGEATYFAVLLHLVGETF